jgi:alpha-beta hydrolase superfamily lysophospholipase
MMNTPLHLPMYPFGGSDDPVSEYGKGIVHLSNTYQLYESGRHEMLNERNRDEVIEDIMKWIYQNVNV